MSPEEEECVRGIVARAPHTRANLALLGDKTFLFSQSRESFLMFGVTGRTWVTMGPPVGREDEAQELIWQFRETCDRHCGRPVFYGVPQDRLHLFWDTGLSLLKIGEEAIVDLPSFHLNGASRQGLRYKKNNLEKNGCIFEVIPPEAPLTLFVWGVKRILPVRLTELGITEEAYDPSLNPVRAKVSLGLRVLNYHDLGLASVGGTLFMAHQIAKEVMATIGSVGNIAGSVSAGINIGG